jgi:AcrR family transcriptional regulator
MKPAIHPTISPSPFRTPQERSEDREAKRQALLVAAVRMFNMRGFHATSLDDVAASLGVTKPVIYHYLGNKDRVLLECVRIGLDQLHAEADAARVRDGTGLDRLKIFLRRYAEVTMHDFGRCVVRTGDEALSEDSRREFRAMKRRIDQALRGLLEDAAADGSARIDDVRLTAFTIAGALNWPARWYDEGGMQSAKTIAAKMVDILCAGIASDRDPPARD